MVSYNEKHNEANGEDNRDGANDNNSWNCGVEGPTDDPAVIELRERQKRNQMATLLLSVGVPMILGGDELSHSQNGNNNTYCQDNELTWLDWDLDDRQKAFLEFTRKCIFIWRTQPVLQRRKFFLGRAIRGSDIKDISFFNPSGQEMSDEDWNAAFVKCLGVRLAGDLINDENERGEPVVGETLLFILNAHWEPIPFTLPGTSSGHVWDLMIDTAITADEQHGYEGGQQYPLKDRSLVLLAARSPEHRGQLVTPTQFSAVLEEHRSSGTKPPGRSPI